MTTPKITHHETGIVHAVRNRRTMWMWGLECGKPGSVAKSEPAAANAPITCAGCRERVMDTGGLTETDRVVA